MPHDLLFPDTPPASKRQKTGATAKASNSSQGYVAVASSPTGSASASHPPSSSGRPQRGSKRPAKFDDAADDDMLIEYDVPDEPNIVSKSDLEDEDYKQLIARRPAQFVNTFNIVYGKYFKAKKRLLLLGAEFHGYIVRCREPNCLGKHHGVDEWIHMDHANDFAEIGSWSTPKGSRIKPPVCHNVPWAALEHELDEKERIRQTVNPRKKLSEHFRRRVCWDPVNLRPGHFGCNAAGSKVTARTMTERDKLAARRVIERVENAWDISKEMQQIWT
jgi:hypothetical protein